jgi:hypothetical protein
VSIASLAVENIFYTMTVAVMLVAGTVSLLWAFQVEAPLRAVSFGVLAVAVAASVAGGWVLVSRRRFLSEALDRAMSWNIGRQSVETWRPRVAAIEDRVYEFVGGHPGRILPIAAVEFGYHAAAIAEIWISLTLITGTPPAPLTALVLEYINRAITIGFQFVPMWLGVDEAGTGAVTHALGLGSAAGISLALARKARIAVWTVVGMSLLARRGISLKAAAARSDFAAIDAN